LDERRASLALTQAERRKGCAAGDAKAARQATRRHRTRSLERYRNRAEAQRKTQSAPSDLDPTKSARSDRRSPNRLLDVSARSRA